MKDTRTFGAPWYAKIAAKIVLARLPFGYRLWERLNIFKHGAMERPEYAYQIFKSHYDRSEFAAKSDGFVALEVGPGDSLFSALCGYAFGANATYLVDMADFARRDIVSYRSMVKFLRERGLRAPDLSRAGSLSDVLRTCRATYMTHGIASLRTVGTDSVHFIWSHAVLEHIREGEFADFMRELHRVLHPAGICSHRVDLADHLGGALNNLRFPQRLWESRWMATSGFYTNRIRYTRMIALFEAAGFSVEVVAVDRWDELPTPRARLARPFRDVSADELRVRSFDVLLRKR